jgi:cytochrome c-type biogenesis protein CcmH/NrfG
LLHTEDFEAAFVMLSQLRHIHPSCPDTLAALGWAGWKTGNHGTNAYDSPDDFLLLALTFDPAHAKALEYFARMAMDQGDVETARNRVLQLLQVTPDSLWAREALEGELASKSKRGLFGARFWPKSSS